MPGAGLSGAPWDLAGDPLWDPAGLQLVSPAALLSVPFLSARVPGFSALQIFLVLFCLGILSSHQPLPCPLGTYALGPTIPAPGKSTRLC